MGVKNIAQINKMVFRKSVKQLFLGKRQGNADFLCIRQRYNFDYLMGCYKWI